MIHGLPIPLFTNGKVQKILWFWDGGLIQPLLLSWCRTGQLLAFKEDVVELFKAHHLVPVQIGLRFEDIFYSRSQVRKVAFTSIIISISSWQEKWTPILNEWQIGETRIGSAQRLWRTSQCLYVDHPTFQAFSDVCYFECFFLLVEDKLQFGGGDKAAAILKHYSSTPTPQLSKLSNAMIDYASTLSKTRKACLSSRTVSFSDSLWKKFKMKK